MDHDTMRYAFETCYDYNLVRPVLSYNDVFNICLLLSATATVVDMYVYYNFFFLSGYRRSSTSTAFATPSPSP